MPGYIAALGSELRWQAHHLHDLATQVDTVFFGGGTPSLMNPVWVRTLLDCIRNEFGLAQGAEVSLEVNPGTLSEAVATQLLEAGVNRLSIGAQSFVDRDLLLLGRIHNPAQALDAVRIARKAGFGNINLDLMFGLPRQSLGDWHDNLRQVLALGVEHLSLYSLILEPGTQLLAEVEAGELEPSSEDLNAEMYELATVTLAKEGFQQYEISNWSRGEAFEAKHNKIYWKNEAYLGVGAGAHSSIHGFRVANTPSMENYIKRNSDLALHKVGPFPAADEILKVDTFTAQQETMMMGLRLTREGVSEKSFRERFGVTIREVFPIEVERIITKGLADWRDFFDGPHLVLTPFGIPLGNQAFQEFV